MSTNRNSFRDQVRKYVLDNIEERSVIDLVEQFKSEAGYSQNIRLKGTIQNAFIEWLKGLPTNVSFDFVNFEIENLLKEWFTNADMVYKENANFTDNYYYFLYREIAYLFEKETKENIANYILK